MGVTIFSFFYRFSGLLFLIIILKHNNYLSNIFSTIYIKYINKALNMKKNDIKSVKHINIFLSLEKIYI